MASQVEVIFVSKSSYSITTLPIIWINLRTKMIARLLGRFPNLHKPNLGTK